MTRTGRRPADTAGRLVLRQLRADRSTVALVAVTVLLVAGVLTAWPRALDGLLGADLAERVSTLTPAQRDLSLSREWFPWGPHDEDPAALFEAESAPLEHLRQALAGPDLRVALGAPEVVLTRARTPIDKGPNASDIVAMTVSLRADPVIDDRVSIVEGRAPGPFTLALPPPPGSDVDDVVRAGPPLEVMVSVDTADRMRWRVGETRELVDPSIPLHIELTGTFEARDADAGYWSHLTSTLFPFIVEDGNVGTTVNGAAYADPSALAVLPIPRGLTLDAWFPVDPAAVVTLDRSVLTAQLRGFLATSRTTSELEGTLEDVAEQQATITTILGVLAVGPAGAAVGVLWLAGVLAVERRRTALVITASRGASANDLRLVMAVQGAVVAIPAAALGALLATLLVPGPTRAGDYLLPGLAALAPALLMALAADRVRHPSDRTDLGSAGPSPATRRRRRVAEVLVLGLAAFATLTVHQRGLSGAVTGPDARIDPFLLASPLLLSLAACVLVLWVYPLPVHALARALHGRRRLPHFLGAVTAARSPAGGLVPVVALVLGVAVAVFSGVVLSTVRSGATETATRAVGADLRIDGAELSPEQVAAVAATDGVTQVAAVGTAGRVVIRVGRSSDRVEVLTVDARALAVVQAGLPGIEPPPEGLDGGTAGGADAPAGVPAIVAARDRVDLDSPISLLLGEDLDPSPLRPLGEQVEVPGIASGKAWVLVDREALRSQTQLTDVVDRLLVRLDPGVSADAVLTAVEDALGAEVAAQLRATTPAAASASLRQAVLVRGMQTGLLVVTALSALLCAVIVLLTLTVGASARGRLFALLATLGTPARTGRRLVLWEIVPLVLVAAVTGTAVGALLPRLLLGVADLRPFTGGIAQPGITADPAVLAALTGAFAMTLAVAVWSATVVAARTPPALVLREGERA